MLRLLRVPLLRCCRWGCCGCGRRRSQMWQRLVRAGRLVLQLRMRLLRLLQLLRQNLLRTWAAVLRMRLWGGVRCCCRCRCG